MSTTVDQRVVEMRFDNKNFESNVRNTMSTLDELKQKLNLPGASKGLENVSSSARRIDFSPLSTAIDSVHTKFSALQVMGVTALANITNSAVNAGKRITSSFTVEPIKTGLQEYETQINAIQTILSNTRSKGTTLEDVNGALDELNTYADKTIYNFTEMTRNIGTFTAAGVDLDTSTKSIKGIANLAAVSGSTSQQASTAMYQLSQALAAGKVSLMDWNSVVNAGMGGQVFQDALKRTAEHMGKDVDGMIKKYGSFRESLTQGEWLTTDVLTETLTQLSGAYSEADLIAQGYTKEQAKEIAALADDAVKAATKVKTFTQLIDTLKEAAQSGWTQTWEILIGDFETAREMWSGLSDYFGDIIGKSAEARNNLLQGWADAGGRTTAIEGIKAAFEGFLNTIKPIKEAFRDVFPAMESKNLVTFTEKFKELSERFRDFTAKHGDNIKKIFTGIFSVIKLGVTVVLTLAGGILKLSGNLKGLVEGLLNIASSFGGWLTGLSESAEKSDILSTAVDKLVGFLQNGIDKLKEFVGFLREKIKMPGWEGFLSLMKSVWGFITKVGGKIAEIGSEIGEALTSAFRTGDISAGLDLLNGGILAGLLLTIKKFIGGISEAFSGENSILDNIKGIFDGLRGSLEAYQNNLKAETLLKIAKAVAMLAVSLVVLALIDPEKLASGLGAITTLFAELMASFALFNKMSGNTSKVVLASGAMIALSVSVLILSSALKVLSTIDPTKMLVSLIGIFGVTMTLVAASKILSSGKGTIVKGSGQLILMAAALKIMASVCKDFSSMKLEEIGRGLIGIGGVLAELTIVSLILSKTGSKMVKGSVGLVLMGAALKILASVCKDFGSMNPEVLVQGLSAITIMLAELTLMSIALSLTGSKMVKGSVGLVIMAGALSIMSNVCAKFGSMNWGSLGKAGVAILGILVMASGFSALAQFSSGLLKAVISLTIMAGAMTIMTSVCAKFGAMDWTALAKAGVAMLGILGLAVAFSALASLSGSMIVSASGLLVMAVALSIFTPVLAALGSMSWETIGKGFLSLAGAFALLGVAGLVLAPVIPAILGLAAALALIGISVVAVGTGLMLVSAGLSALAVAGTAGATALVAALAIIITGILNLIPTIIAKLGEALILLCQVIIMAVPAIGMAITAIVVTIANVIIQSAPKIGEAVIALIVMLSNVIIQSAPSVINAIMTVIGSLLKALVDNVPSFVQAGFDIILGFLSGIKNNIGEVVSVAVDIVTTFVKAIGDKLPDLMLMGVDLVVNLINGLANGIRDRAADVKAAIENLCQAIIDAFKIFFGIHSPSKVFAELGGFLIQGLINGIKNLISAPVKLIKSLGGKLVNGIKEKGKEFLSNGKKLMGDLKSGISSKVSDVVSGAKTVVSKCVTAIGEKVESFKEKGGEFISKLKSGMSDKVEDIKTKAGEITTSVINKFKDKYEEFKTAGKNMMSGLKSGIESFSSKAVEAAKGVAQNAIEGAKKLLGIHSPSKVFYEIGGFTGEGFTNALIDAGKASYKSGASLGESARKGISRSIAAISDAINSDIDAQPTIRPVIDLSDIRSGAGLISDMFNDGTIGLRSNVSAISSMMNQNRQNGVNDDVVSAIDKLNKSLNNLEKPSYVINGVTYDDGSNVSSAVESLVRAARIERRV